MNTPELVDYLKATQTLPGGAFRLEKFVLEHGMPFTTMAAKQPKPGTPKQCYCNSARKVLRQRKPELIYVEGFAISMIPMMHAWCVNQDGHIIETTWRRQWMTGVAYFGIPFDQEYLRRSLQKWKQFGLLENWKGEWPVQNSPRSEWIHPKYATQTATQEAVR